MNVFKAARYFARGLLLSPVFMVVLWLIIRFMPGLAALLGKVVWGLLGQISAFSQASSLLEEFLNHNTLDLTNLFLAFCGMLSALGDTLIVACCIFLVKSVHTTFTRKQYGRFTKPVWLLTLIGVTIGVVVCAVKDGFGPQYEAILLLIVCLSCYIVGLVLLLRGPKLTKGGTYSKRKAGFIATLMLGIVGDLLDAVCAVFVVTGIIDGPRLVKDGGNGWYCIVWIVLSALILFGKNALVDAAQPKEE